MNIILGITGGIAAYKSAELARALVKLGFNVQVVMTESAKQFVTELTLQALTGREVRSQLFDKTAELGMSHIELAKWADVILIAPTTANYLAKIANGMADDLLLSVCLALDVNEQPHKKIVLAPAMNTHMWQHPLVQQNLAKLVDIASYEVIKPEQGPQACGDTGIGRLAELYTVIGRIKLLNKARLLDSQQRKSKNIIEFTRTKESVAPKLLITAGPTQENIDPVRFISNHSSGKMGYALANVANQLGYQVTLISGPVSDNLISELNSDIKLIKVSSADDMLAAVQQHIMVQDVFIGVAAVADYKCIESSPKKIKKHNQYLELKLEKNPDIIKYVGKYKKEVNSNLIVIGFAAETHDFEQNALIKLRSKNLDIIVLNDVTNNNIGFNSDNNAVKLLFDNGEAIKFEIQPKKVLAEKILSHISIRIRDESRSQNIR